VAIAVIVASTLGVGSLVLALVGQLVSPGNPGDPGGRILAEISPITAAVPPTAHVNYTQIIDAERDACEGSTVPNGWMAPAVYENFTWPVARADVLVAFAERTMRRGAWVEMSQASLLRSPAAQQIDAPLVDGRYEHIWLLRRRYPAFAELWYDSPTADWTLAAFAKPALPYAKC
jgi:hypothetical protein